MKTYLEIIALCELHRALMNLHYLTGRTSHIDEAEKVSNVLQALVRRDKAIDSIIGEPNWIADVERYYRITVGELPN